MRAPGTMEQPWAGRIRNFREEPRMRVHRCSTIGILFGAALLAGPAHAAEKVTWNWSVHGPSRAFTKGMERIAEIAAEKTGGDFTIKVHFAEAVSPAKEVLDSVKIGAIEGGSMCISHEIGREQCSERVCQYVYIPGGAGPIKQPKKLK